MENGRLPKRILHQEILEKERINIYKNIKNYIQ
jgi:hypothetical protein